MQATLALGAATMLLKQVAIKRPSAVATQRGRWVSLFAMKGLECRQRLH